MAIDDLVAALKAIEDSDLECVDYLHEHEDNPLVERCEAEANATLITNEGRCNIRAMIELEKVCERWKAFAGDSDSFGWLTGCIRTTKGVLVYG
jgi:hypothetical protein